MLIMLIGGSNIKTMNVNNLGKAISALKWKKSPRAGTETNATAIGYRNESLPWRGEGEQVG
jgi:hypothetical protein